MTSKRIAPLLLAASVFLTGTTGILLGSITPVHAITSVDELSDANRNHWAYEALQDLVEKYDVIEGYPSKTFKGNHTATRWEMAAALNALIKSVGRDLARMGAEKANKADLATLARLQDEFKNELAALSARTTALEGRASAIEAKNLEQDNRLGLLERTQIHGDMSFGGLADIAANGRRANNSTARDGIKDGISSIGRLRLTLDVPVKEDRDDSLIGEGTIHTRLIAAFGRVAPLSGQDGNLGGFNPFTGYSRIAGDASQFNEGSRTGNLNSGNNLRPNLYLENVFYKQHLKSGIPLLTAFAPGAKSDNWKATGDMYLGLVPWRYLFDTSPYRGNELTQFQNTAFVNTPGIAVNSVSPTVAYQVHQGLGKYLSMDITGAASTLDYGDFVGGLNTSYEAKLNYKTDISKNFLRTGSIYGGGFNAFNAGNRLLTDQVSPFRNRLGFVSPTGTNNNSLNAVYGGWSQDWYKGIGTTFNYTLSNSGATNMFYNSTQTGTGINAARVREATGVGVHQAATGVLNVPMKALIPGFRDKDAMGFAYGIVDLYRDGLNGGKNKNGSGQEQVAEFYYRMQLTDSISVIPSYQIIMNRLGLRANDAAHVIGLRTSFVF